MSSGTDSIESEEPVQIGTKFYVPVESFIPGVPAENFVKVGGQLYLLESVWSLLSPDQKKIASGQTSEAKPPCASETDLHAYDQLMDRMTSLFTKLCPAEGPLTESCVTRSFEYMEPYTIVVHAFGSEVGRYRSVGTWNPN